MCRESLLSGVESQFCRDELKKIEEVTGGAKKEEASGGRKAEATKTESTTAKKLSNEEKQIRALKVSFHIISFVFRHDLLFIYGQLLTTCFWISFSDTNEYDQTSGNEMYDIRYKMSDSRPTIHSSK